MRFIRTSTNSSSVQSDGDNVLYALNNSNYTIALLQRSIRKCFSVNSFPNLALFGFASEEKKIQKICFIFFVFGKALATFIGRLHKSFVHALSNYIATGKKSIMFPQKLELCVCFGHNILGNLDLAWRKQMTSFVTF